MIRSTERKALDTLLARYPGFDLLSVDWQLDDDAARVDLDWRVRPRGFAGPWVLVELGQRSDDGAEVWARHRFAIFKRTGAIHGLQADGSVTDEALLT